MIDVEIDVYAHDDHNMSVSVQLEDRTDVGIAVVKIILRLAPAP